MHLKILGSSSKGNCYILEGKNDSIIIEAGIKLNQIKKGVDYNLSKVRGCLISHEHL